MFLKIAGTWMLSTSHNLKEEHLNYKFQSHFSSMQPSALPVLTVGIPECGPLDPRRSLGILRDPAIVLAKSWHNEPHTLLFPYFQIKWGLSVCSFGWTASVRKWGGGGWGLTPTLAAQDSLLSPPWDIFSNLCLLSWPGSYLRDIYISGGKQGWLVIFWNMCWNALTEKYWSSESQQYAGGDFESKRCLRKKSAYQRNMSPETVISSSGKRRAKSCTEPWPGELYEHPGGFFSGWNKEREIQA